MQDNSYKNTKSAYFYILSKICGIYIYIRFKLFDIFL